MKVTILQNLKENEHSTAHGLFRCCWGEGRKGNGVHEEKGVFEAIDEEECLTRVASRSS